MKRIIGILLISMCIIVAGTGSIFFFQTRQKHDVNDVTPTINILPSITHEPRYVDQKLVVDCSFFDQNPDFPVDSEKPSRRLSTILTGIPSTHMICGYSKTNDTMYVTTTVSDKNALDYYIRKLEALDCTTEGTRSAPGDRRYMFSLPFSCSDGDGVVATFATVSAYVVMFESR